MPSEYLLPTRDKYTHVYTTVYPRVHYTALGISPMERSPWLNLGDNAKSPTLEVRQWLPSARSNRLRTLDSGAYDEGSCDDPIAYGEVLAPAIPPPHPLVLCPDEAGQRSNIMGIPRIRLWI